MQGALDVDERDDVIVLVHHACFRPPRDDGAEFARVRLSRGRRGRYCRAACGYLSSRAGSAVFERWQSVSGLESQTRQVNGGGMLPAAGSADRSRVAQERVMSTAWTITFDCADPATLAAFWCQALGYVEGAPPTGCSSWEEYLASVGVPPEEWG